MSENTNKPLLVIDDYTAPVIVKDFLTRQYKEETDENGETVLRELPVSVLPDIELYVNIGGTNYYVSGSYTVVRQIKRCPLRQIIRRGFGA